MTKKLYTDGALVMFIGSILFSVKAILVKVSYKYGIDAVSLLMLRMIFSLPFFGFIAVKHYIQNKKAGYAQLSRADWLKITFLGIIGYYLASIFDFEGLKYVSAGVERLILFIYPTLVVVISSIRDKRNIKKYEIMALILTYFGVGFVYFHEVSPNGYMQIYGVGLVFMSALTYAIYLIGSGEIIPKIGAVYYTSLAMVISTLAISIHYLVYHFGEMKSFSSDVYLITLLMAIFCTVIPGYMVAWSIKKIGSSNSSIIASVGPVSTIILAYFFLGEGFSTYQIIGTILVLTGVLIVGSQKN